MKVLVIGAGAAGMMAAISAAYEGNEVIVYEHNEKPGKKIYITGKGRCNITNACETEELFPKIMSNSKFMYSAIYNFTNQDAIDMFNRLGCSTKVERGDRVFPVSDKSSDVISALQKEMKKNNIKLYYNANVEDVCVEEGKFVAIKVSQNGKKMKVNGDKLIIATGGLSYPSTGSTGDGYEFARKLGHTVTELRPSLVPYNLKGSEYRELQGLSLRNVDLTVKINDNKIYKDMGELLFTHFGISGPLVLSSCSILIKELDKINNKNKKKKAKGQDLDNIDVKLSIDLKPALTVEQLDGRILRDFEKNINKNFSNSLDELLPKKLIPIVIRRSNIDPNKKVSFVTKEERNKLVSVIKNLDYDFLSFRGYAEAIITKGGVSVKEINPSTMESKIVKGVFFAGEVLDVDAVTGGYNLQIAWSTGYLAGQNN